MYKELAAVYKEFRPEVEALAKRINARVREVDPEGKVCDIFNYCPWVQLYVDKPSEGAEFNFEGDDTKYYETTYDGVRFVEMVEANDKA